MSETAISIICVAIIIACLTMVAPVWMYGYENWAELNASMGYMNK